MKCSCIDIGSNTIKVSVFEKIGRHWKTAFYLGEQTGLISFVVCENGSRYLSNDGVFQMCETLKRLVAFSEKNGCFKIFAFATAALRGIDNIHHVLDEIKSSVGISVEVLSEEEEALCSLRGLLSDEMCEGVNEGIMVDMGGGSSEIVYFKNGEDPKITSLKIGCLDLTNKFIKSFPPKEEEIIKIREYVKNELRDCFFAKNTSCPVFLIGGTARAVLKLSSAITGKNKVTLLQSDFDLIVSGMVKEADVQDAAKRIIPKRLYNITAGAAAYSEIIKYVSGSVIRVSESGVREGYLERILV